MGISYKCLTTIEDLEKVVDLEIRVWQLPARDAVPSSLLHAMVENGSVVVGAWNTTSLIGMAFMFPSPNKREKLLWSHMAAVDPSYQGQGIGYSLKQFQRNWALQHGYDTIAWTYDPLQRGNANFNLHILGGSSSVYHVNYYGNLTDGLNAGLPSDRLEVHWNLKSLRVKKLSTANFRVRTSNQIALNPENLLLTSTNGEPKRQLIELNKEVFFVEIPTNINQLKIKSKHLALAWRIELRNTLMDAFNAGYILEDLVTLDENKSYYVLSVSKKWYLYVVECNDQTLYTGITPDITKRLNIHNRGRGAAYTRSRRPVTLLASWIYPNRGSATQAEFLFKKLTREAKLDYIRAQRDFHNAPFVHYAL